MHCRKSDVLGDAVALVGIAEWMGNLPSPHRAFIVYIGSSHTTLLQQARQVFARLAFAAESLTADSGQAIS